jgi:hypothetical protein
MLNLDGFSSDSGSSAVQAAPAAALPATEVASGSSGPVALSDQQHQQQQQQQLLSVLSLFGESDGSEQEEPVAKRCRGRPRKHEVQQKQKRPKGRPRKPTQPQLVSDSLVAAQVGDGVLAALACEASVVGQLAVLAGSSQGVPVKQHINRVSDYVLGGTARPASSLKCEASFVGMWPQNFKQMCSDMGAIAFVGNRMMFSAWASQLLRQLDVDLEPIAFLTSVKYDETPLPFSLRESRTSRRAEMNRRGLVSAYNRFSSGVASNAAGKLVKQVSSPMDARNLRN